MEDNDYKYDNKEYENNNKNDYNSINGKKDKLWVVFVCVFILFFVIFGARLVILGVTNTKKKPYTVAKTSTRSNASNNDSVIPPPDYNPYENKKEKPRVKFHVREKKTEPKPEPKPDNSISNKPVQNKKNNDMPFAPNLRTETSAEINTKTEDSKPVVNHVAIGKYLQMTEQQMLEEIEIDFRNDVKYNMAGLVPVPVPIPTEIARVHIAQVAILKDCSLVLDKLCKKDFHPLKEPEAFHEGNSRVILALVILAADLDHRKSIDVLIKNGADLKIEAPKPKTNNSKAIEEGKTLLHCAAQHGNTDLMKKVIDAGVPIDKKTVTGKTPLYFAVKNNQYESAYILINKGAVREESLKSETKDEKMLKLLETGKY
ncbi:MAG: ankyrin repeat domain-containing protein [Candidatus Riflebacteria bacterium]|nr:ankyrin repeat domain-containing protein [Candidatus Riflebacteria bacterium]